MKKFVLSLILGLCLIGSVFAASWKTIASKSDRYGTLIVKACDGEDLYVLEYDNDTEAFLFCRSTSLKDTMIQFNYYWNQLSDSWSRDNAIADLREKAFKVYVNDNGAIIYFVE